MGPSRARLPVTLGFHALQCGGVRGATGPALLREPDSAVPREAGLASVLQLCPRPHATPSAQGLLGPGESVTHISLKVAESDRTRSQNSGVIASALCGGGTPFPAIAIFIMSHPEPGCRPFLCF